MDKKQQLLDTALRLFVEYGFHGTPTSRIAKDAGVANGTLFHYFPTKDDLIIALYVDLKTQMSVYIAANTQAETTLKGALKGQYLATLYWAMDHKMGFKYIEQFNNSPFIANIAPETIQKQIQPHLDMFQQGIDTNIIKPMPTLFIYSLVMSHTYGLNQYLTSHEFSKVQQHELISNAFEMLWKMVT
jgi:AcrR family transcriptional regulator